MKSKIQKFQKFKMLISFHEKLWKVKMIQNLKPLLVLNDTTSKSKKKNPRKKRKINLKIFLSQLQIKD